mgnify:CR=1 FL=1
MKKLVVLVFSVVVLALCASASANYPTYLNGNRDFILCDGHMGTAWYVDRTSLTVQKYEPPQYIIAVNVITANSAVGDERDFYNGGSGTIRDVRQMYVEGNVANDWRLLPPTGSWAETGISMPAGEIAFYLAYHMKFYGSRKFYNRFLNKNVDVYTDDFYAKIP